MKPDGGCKSGLGKSEISNFLGAPPCSPNGGEIHKDSILPKEKIIIVDDLIATGGTSEAAAKLVEKSDGEVCGFIFVINLFDLGGKKLLEKKGYKTFSLIDFPGH